MNASACLNNNDVINMFRSHLTLLTSGFIPIVSNSSHEHCMCHHKYILFYDDYVFLMQRKILCPVSSL
jgi:hypothetical protein